MENLSIVIITFNEEKNIERCILSVKEIADDIVVLDSNSTDQTIEICEKLGARVFSQKFLGHIEQKNCAISFAKFPFILSLDADEAVDEELKTEILKIKQNKTADGYIINRYNNYCGKWIRHGAWFPDHKLRLWDSTKGKWAGLNPHDKFELISNSKSLMLKGNILHWSYSTLEEHKNKIESFSTIAAKAYFLQGKRSSQIRILFSPIFRFIKDYFFRFGFLDGSLGWFIASLTFKEIKLKYKKLLDIQNET